VEKELRGTGEKKGKWDKECKEKKREVRGKIEGMEEGRGEEIDYRKIRREYRELCDKKKKEKNKKWEKIVMEVRRENEVWGLINRERKRRSRINEEIEMKEWKVHFLSLLGGIEERVLMGVERNRGGEEEEEKEIREAIRKLKERKAIGGEVGF